MEEKAPTECPQLAAMSWGLKRGTERRSFPLSSRGESRSASAQRGDPTVPPEAEVS